MSSIIHKSNLALRTHEPVFSEAQAMAPVPPSHDRVFVVDLSRDADPSRGHLFGRLEHVDSGRSVRFTSNEEMNEFFARILCEEVELQPGHLTKGQSK